MKNPFITKTYNKRNDPSWCQGVFGIIGGGLMILLSIGKVIDLVTTHTLALFSVVYFVIGIQSYLTWRWKRRFLKALQTFTAETETFSSKCAELSAEFEKISKAQPTGARDGVPAAHDP